MKHSAKKLWLSFGLICAMLGSCNVLQANPSKAPIDFDPAYLNQQIKLVVVKELSAFNTTDDVAVLLGYYTTNEIVLPNNFNLRLFIEQNDQWVEIKEQPTIRPKEPVILSPKIPSSYGQIVAFWPQLPDRTKRYSVRLYVFGDMTTPEGQKHRVAAFCDFVLRP
jgi:hypothetical protein